MEGEVLKQFREWWQAFLTRELPQEKFIKFIDNPPKAATEGFEQGWNRCYVWLIERLSARGIQVESRLPDPSKIVVPIEAEEGAVARRNIGRILGNKKEGRKRERATHKDRQRR